MIPIVEPHACVSGEPQSLRNYLTQSQDFHILKMVAVQQPQEQSAAAKEIHDLYKVSITRGLGGFPNKLVAYCDLLKAGSVSSFCKNNLQGRLQGVNYHFSQDQSSVLNIANETAVNDVLKAGNLDVLNENGMSLDITVGLHQTDIPVQIAQQYPNLSIIVSLQCSDTTGDTSNDDLRFCVAKLSRYDGISIKAGAGLFCVASQYKGQLKEFLSLAVQHFGYERIMFASANSDSSLALSFAERWQSYVSVASTFSALQRDKIFRSNAVRIYKL